MHAFLRGNPTVNAIVASLLILTILSVSYFTFEPIVAYGITDNFTVEQQVTSEISWRTLAGDVTMTPTIAGLTGGNSYGTSTFAINTNNTTGYNMTLAFATTVAMQGENVTSDIDNYTPAVAGTPDYTFAVGVNDAEFAYSVNGVTTATDVDARFKHNGSACNTSTQTTVGRCWYGTAAAASAVTIINRSTATPGTGATSTLVFRVGITANPSPAIQTGYYTATATLTAVTNP